MVKLKEILTEGTKKFFYHATTCEALPSIVARGLVPTEGDTTWGGDLGKFSEGKVFLTEKFETAVYYGNAGIWKKEHHNRFKPLLRVRLDAILLTPDPQSQYDFYSEVAVAGPFDLYVGETNVDDRGDLHPQNTAGAWRPLTHQNADSIYHGEWDGEIIDDEDEELMENTENRVLLGAITPGGDVRGVWAQNWTHNELARHPASMRSDLRWRYYPEISQLDWWETPTDEQREKVGSWIADRELEIKRVHILTRRGFAESRLRTKQGSAIQRFKNNVGKQVGKRVYVHKLYADDIIPKAVWLKANDILTKAYPDFAFNTVMFNPESKTVRFDQAADFDTASEPHVGDFVEINVANPNVRTGHSDSIWHHKWLWVKDDYTGFDVDKSKEWSKLWLSKLDEPAKGQEIYWQSQLRNAGLLTEGSRIDQIDQLIQQLETEWERLDSQGTGHSRQMEIQRELTKLRTEKERWNTIYRAIETEPNRGIVKTRIMEVTQEQANAAIDFLKQKVSTGPFKGMVFLAGGPVRDMVMGKTPKDLDVSIVGDVNGGINFATWLAKQMGNFKGPTTPPPKPPSHIEVDYKGYPVFSPITNDPAFGNFLAKYDAYYAQFSNPVLFPKFGTAKVFLSGTHNGVSLEGMDVEAVAARKEVYTPGSRKPQVFPGTLKDDVFRRDFTTNSLMFDLTTGEMHDLTGRGISDIKAGLLRTTSDPLVIFKEDPLRMMRAVRFMVQKGWKIDPETEASIKTNASWLRSISRERVRDELNKMLVTGSPQEAIVKLRDLGLLPYVAPELQKAVGMTQNIHHKHDVFDHTLEVLKSTKPELVQRLLALFHDIGKIATRSESPTGVHFYGHEYAGEEMVDKILHNLKYPVEIINAVKMGVKNHMRLKKGGDDAVQISDKALRKFKIELGDNLETVLDLIHADNISHADASAMPNQIEKVRARLKALDIQVKKPVLPINGNDLIALGVKPGPLMGKILSAVTDAWFENPNITRDDAIRIVKQMV